jgi:hypothetical protein
MNKKIGYLLLLAGTFVFQLKIFSQSPNYTGTWVLNLDKSKLEDKSKGQTGSIFIIKQAGDKFNLKINHIYGDKKKKIGFKMTANGKTRRVKILFKGKLEQKENSLQASLWRKNFSNIVNYQFGENQNEFIADEVFTGRPKNYHNIWVFDRKVEKYMAKVIQSFQLSF